MDKGVYEDKVILLKEYPEHIKGYGFTEDLINGTCWGYTQEELDQYYAVWEEFEEDPCLPKHIVNIANVPYQEIPRGILRVYARCYCEKN